MDRLEEYIRKNRDDMDKYDPPEIIWKEIRKGTRNGRPNLFKWISVAAVIAVMLTTAGLFYVGEIHRQSYLSGKGNDALLMKNNPQLRETEIYYNNLVNDLYNEATPLLSGFPDVEKELVSDMSQLDSICNDIKKDLHDNIANQEVIEALINNYRIKIHILQDMVNVLKQNEKNPEKNNSHAL